MAKDDQELTKEELMAGEDKEPGRFESAAGRWLRRAIFVGLLLVVAVVLVWLVYIGPRAAEITQLQAQVSADEAQIATLEAQVAALETVKPQREVMSLLVDANNARYELARSQPDSAAAALLNSSRTITLLGTELGPDYADTIASLSARLAQAKADIASEEKFAAIADLDVFINTLLQLQRGLLAQ